MCGIFGIVDCQDGLLAHDLKEAMESLYRLSESRGKEAAGFAMLSGNTIAVYKEPLRGRAFIEKQSYKDLFGLLAGDLTNTPRSPCALLGHARLATNGPQTDNRNNQPVAVANIVGIHNGIVVNDEKLWKRILKKTPSLDVDTEVLLELMRHYLSLGMDLASATRSLYDVLEGSASIALLFSDQRKLLLATNTGSLYFAKVPPSLTFFASEQFILEEFFSANRFEDVSPIVQLSPFFAMTVDLLTGKENRFSLRSRQIQSYKKSKPKQVFNIHEVPSDERISQRHSSILGLSISNKPSALEKHKPDLKAIRALRRCARCILPETMPFISFDMDGVCNYCHAHTKIAYKGKQALEDIIAPYRSNSGKPDCIIAFSGGRDSSYGLHLLKRELGMNPIAYTYDWGMVTDIARRNEARLVGKLGIEHVIVSADIRMKRDHIRKHILAWTKKPNLGMVPLFMEGDKQCEYYANQLAKKTGVRLIFFARGNELETEEFKWGHCGIRQATPQGVIHNLSFRGKTQLLSYYAWQYINNPAYINSSFVDTLFAYVSTYVIPHEYLYLWHYIPWNEDTIISTLRAGYGWETEKGAKQTWRTDDGTSSFYNYIYLVGQGFTENDTFRSNQIREGILERNAALELVYQENKPRYEALAWYFDRVGLNGDEVLGVVDRMQKLY